MRKEERGFSLAEVIAFLFLAGVVGAIVFSVGFSQYMRRVAVDEAHEIASLEGAVAIAWEQCRNGTYSGTIQVPYYSSTISVSFSCTDISSNLVRVEVFYEGRTATGYFYR